MQQLSHNFGKLLHEIFPDTIRPDEAGGSSSRKAPDHFMPVLRIAIERKTVTLDLGVGQSVGKKLQAAKKESFVIFGTAHVKLDCREALTFADKMTGGLRSRIREAEKQLESFCEGNEDILTVCCIFAETSRIDLLEWDRKYLPNLDLARASAFSEFEARRIDAMLLFTLDHNGQFCLDVAQTVYAGDHLKKEFEALLAVVAAVTDRLPVKPNASVRASSHFQPF